jgi:hydroxymethylpyrimidine/phosphomethylpyrimidine kinase
VLIEELLPLTTVLTLNMAEAAALLLVQHQHSLRLHSGRAPVPVPATIISIEDMLHAPWELCALSPCTVLLKGGHMAHGVGMRIGDVQAATMGNQRVHRITLECDGSIGYELNMEILFRAQAAALWHSR